MESRKDHILVENFQGNTLEPPQFTVQQSYFFENQLNTLQQGQGDLEETKNDRVLMGLKQMIFQKERGNYLMSEWVVSAWDKLAGLLKDNAQIMDLVERTKLITDTTSKDNTPANILADMSHQKKCFPLYINQTGLTTAGLIAVFKREAWLCSNSSIQFYNDASATKVIFELKAGIQGRGSIPPIIFNQG